MKSLQAEERRAVLPSGAELTYYVAGNGPPVLLLNGLGGPVDVWGALVAHLRDRYRMVFFEYRGLHRSATNAPEPLLGVAEHARDARSVLDAEGIKRCAVVGWSMGVQVGLELFRSSPSRVASLVLINGAARPSWAREHTEGVAGRVVARGFALLRRAPRLLGLGLNRGLRAPETFTWARRLGLVGDQVDAETFAALARGFETLDATAYVTMLQRLGEHDASDVLRMIDVPLLVIAGDRDPFTSRAAMERMVNEVAGAEYLALPGATHYVPLDQAERVSLRIEKFWSERGYRGESGSVAASQV